jgi:hypothetical protein
MSSDTRCRLSVRLTWAAAAAERGDHLNAKEIGGAADMAFWQECLADYEQAKAKAKENAPLIEVWGGRSQEPER